MITLQPINLVQAASDLLWSRVLQKFPKLKFAMSEGGIGWIPYFLERVDYVYKHHQAWTGQDLGGMLPSELFNERIVTCFHRRRGRPREPDITSTWTTSPGSATTRTPTPPGPGRPRSSSLRWRGSPTRTSTRSPHENAIRLFSYDPFKHIPKEQANVGALRALAKDVDVSERAVTGAQPRDKNEPPITIMTIVAAATGGK